MCAVSASACASVPGCGSFCDLRSELRQSLREPTRASSIVYRRTAVYTIGVLCLKVHAHALLVFPLPAHAYVSFVSKGGEALFGYYGDVLTVIEPIIKYRLDAPEVACPCAATKQHGCFLMIVMC